MLRPCASTALRQAHATAFEVGLWGQRAFLCPLRLSWTGRVPCCLLPGHPSRTADLPNRDQHVDSCHRGSIGMTVPRRRRGGYIPPLDPPPPQPDQSDHRGRRRNSPLGKSDRAFFGTRMLGSQTPQPPLWCAAGQAFSDLNSRGLGSPEWDAHVGPRGKLRNLISWAAWQHLRRSCTSKAVWALWERPRKPLPIPNNVGGLFPSLHHPRSKQRNTGWHASEGRGCQPPPFNNSAPLDGWGAHTPPRHPPCPPPRLKRLGQIFFWTFGQLKIFSGIFSASKSSAPPEGGGGGQQEREPIRGRPAVRGKRTYGGRPGQRVEEQGTWASQKHSEAGYGRPVDRGRGQ